MSLFHDIELFALGAATVIDTALLMVLTDRSNRRRLILPLFLLVFGAWLFHSGAALKALLAELGDGWAVQLHWLSMLAMTSGLLLMPSAMLHGVWRAGTTGLTSAIPYDSRYALFYLPLLLIFPASAQLGTDPVLPYAELLTNWILPYAVWLVLVNSISGLRLLSLRHTFLAAWARLFARAAGICLLGLAAFQALFFFVVLPGWPQQQHYWHLLLYMSPLLMALLISFFILRFNLMQLVLERVFVYGVVVTAAMLFHQVFLQELWQTLSSRYQINFAIVEGIALIALVMLIKPIRQRSAEALRYLLGSHIDALRRNTRQFSLQLSAQAEYPPQQICDWFCQLGPSQLESGPITLWLFTSGQRATLRAGNPAIGFSSNDARTLTTLLKQQQRLFCNPFDAPNEILAERLQQDSIALAVVLEHPSVNGLIVFTRGKREFYEEQVNALVMVSEQLAITISNSQLQAARLAAERRAHQNEKLSTMGLIASSIAHEVKNPLGSIKTIATVMAEDLAPEDIHGKDIRLIIAEIDRLGTTVDRLLRFARPASHPDRCSSLNEVITGILHVITYLATKNGVAIDNQLVTDLPLVDADENVLREIFFNLIVNAVDAASSVQSGRVTISAAITENHLVIDVQDNGRGIASELQQDIFHPFVSHKQNGTGLGLYLVVHNLDDIGGTISCDSQPDRGTTFSVTLLKHKARHHDGLCYD